MDQKVAIITAAGKGIGAAIARELAADGYQVALLSNTGGAKNLAEELGGLGYTGSVTEAKDLSKMVDKTMEHYSRIDAVVNNTGHPPKGELLEIPDVDWQTGLDMLLLNVVRMARLVTPIMENQNGGAFVNISTFSAFEPELDFPVSSSLRAALGSFTKLFADRYASSGIRMNNILPGYVDSYPMNEETLAEIPAGRYGKVEEIAKTARFLLSPEAGYITGQNIRVDGGLTHSV
jgi:NAD(P)-dependent dehydrogenase (short-subunit alcohol dehydrogenase family)